MAEEKKTQVIIDEEAFKDEESAYPGAPLSDNITKERMNEMMNYRKMSEDRIDLMYSTIHPGYGHMSTDQILALAEERKVPIIPNPNTNPQWSEIMDDAITFAATISAEEDIEKIQAALHKFIDVDKSSSRFIRRAMANSILKSEVKRRVKSKIDCKKMLEDHEYNAEEIKDMINETYGAPKKYKPHPETSFASIYVDYEGDGVK